MATEPQAPFYPETLPVAGLNGRCDTSLARTHTRTAIPARRCHPAGICFFFSGYALIRLDTRYGSINDPGGRPFRVPIRQNAQICTT